MPLPDRLVNDIALPLLRAVSGDVFRSAEHMRRHAAKRALRPASHAPPRRLTRHLDVQVRRVGGSRVYELAPHEAAPAIDVVYLHGGSYVNEIVGQHWALAAELCREVPARMRVPIYPLAPLATAAAVVAGTVEVATASDRPFVLAGDSAGGGLALATALALRDGGDRLPERLVLIAPWLDVGMSDPRQREIEPRDKMLRRPGLAEAGRMYAGGLPVDDPRVSPIRGDLAGLPPITVLVGTADILHPDALRLAEAGAAAGVEVDLHEVEGAPHVFPLLPSHQGGAARRLLVETIRP